MKLYVLAALLGYINAQCSDYSDSDDYYYCLELQYYYYGDDYYYYDPYDFYYYGDYYETFNEDFESSYAAAADGTAEGDGGNDVSTVVAESMLVASQEILGAAMGCETSADCMEMEACGWMDISETTLEKVCVPQDLCN